MRVTGGRLGGRRLVSPPTGVRPTADRVRESLFARLLDLDGVNVLDLYAGTGALGIEALSRGAARVVRGEVSGALRRLAGEGLRFDLVLADPPYEDDAIADSLGLLVTGQLLAPDAVVVVE